MTERLSFHRISEVGGWRVVWSKIRQLFSPQPTFTMTVQQQVEDSEITDARYAATAHAQSGDYRKAVAELDRVHQLETAGGEEPQIHSEIRRAKYLQKAGDGAVAWRVFLGLLNRHGGEPWTIIDLFDAMRLHLQREGKANEAIAYGVAHRLARVQLYRAMKADAEAALKGPIEAYGSANLERMIRHNHQCSIVSADTWLKELSDPADISKMSATLCKKAGSFDKAESLAEQITKEIENRTEPFDYLDDKGVKYAVHRG